MRSQVRERSASPVAGGEVELPNVQRLVVVHAHPVVRFLGVVLFQHAADSGLADYDPSRSVELDPVLLVRRLRPSGNGHQRASDHPAAHQVHLHFRPPGPSRPSSQIA